MPRLTELTCCSGVARQSSTMLRCSSHVTRLLAWEKMSHCLHTAAAEKEAAQVVSFQAKRAPNEVPAQALR